jgi:hypothetical protein
MKKILFSIFVFFPLFVVAQRKEYTTKGYQVYAVIDGNEPMKMGLDLESIMKWYVNDTSIQQIDVRREDTLNFRVAKVTRMKGGDVVYDTSDEYPMRFVFTAKDITFYDEWPSWVKGTIYPVRQKPKN